MSAQQSTPDPAEAARVFAEVAERSGKLLADFAQRHAGGMGATLTDEFGLAKAFMDLAAAMFANPWKLAEQQTRMMWDYAALWQSSMLKLMGQEAGPVAAPAKGDNRFRDADWQNNFVFDYLKQSYLIAARHIHDAVTGVEGLPEDTRKKVDFFTRQYVDALAPSNFAFTNPQVLRETLASGGQNLVRGLNNLLADLEKGDGRLRIRMSDEGAFKLGVNVATTPGKVVFQNDLIQLIQYAPTTQTVYRRPLLVIPPWINKYYILDLRENNSFIRWAVGEGHTVFVVSWVNPDARYAGKGFENYMLEGSLAAIDAVGKATGERDLNVIGYCLGGTLLGATLAYMAEQEDTRAAAERGGAPKVASATFFVSLLDFSIPGELGVFIDEQQVQNLERKMNERGYLEGSEMAATFNLLRANDLIWSFVINNYLLGKEPFPFDLLYWNADSTRMPAKMHSFYLRRMYLENKLKDPGGITLGGVPIDLRKISLPAYFISTAEDHIAPWKSTYKGARILAGATGPRARPAGPVRFVLGGSGHIAGIVNPPSAKKYGYWTNAELPESPDAWQQAAEWHEGSWWTDWQRWIAGHNGEARVPARVPGTGGLKAIEDAPGAYVAVRHALDKPEPLPAVEGEKEPLR
jgi:polyhydroxyalkanoate synthase subunit PhaC